MTKATEYHIFTDYSGNDCRAVRINPEKLEKLEELKEHSPGAARQFEEKVFQDRRISGVRFRYTGFRFDAKTRQEAINAYYNS